MARERLSPGKLKQHRREIEQDEGRKREAIQELRQDFRGYAEKNFELDDNQRRELERTPRELHDMCGQACALALEKGWDVELVPLRESSNLRVEVYCNVEGECGVRISGEC